MADFKQKLSLAGIIIGFYLTLIPFLPGFTASSMTQIITSAAGGIFVAIGTYIFGSIQEEKNMRFQIGNHVGNMKPKLKERLRRLTKLKSFLLCYGHSGFKLAES